MRKAVRRSPARCATRVKFTDLISFARDLGADCLATGHYVRRVEREGRIELWKDATRPATKSYFLYGTT
jgi:tRNA-specific 2-thiouridylase